MALGFASDEATVVQIKHLLGVFARHIGNRAHAVVDRAHLREIAEQLAQLAGSITDVAAPVVATIAVRRQLVTALLDELDAAAAAPPGAEARALLAANLAARANQQFRLHKILVAGRPYARPALVARIVANLADIEAAMAALPDAALANPAQHANNLALVRRERARIEAERQPAPAALVELLAAAAAAERLEHREHAIELERVGDRCDRLGELAHQLARLPGDAARAAFADVIAQLAVAEAQYQALVEERQQTPPLARIAASAEALRRQLMAADAPERVRRDAVARLDALLADPLVAELA